MIEVIGYILVGIVIGIAATIWHLSLKYEPTDTRR